MSNQNTIFTTVLLVLGCVALSPVAQARQPGEDRGNGNTADGFQALYSNTTGSANTAIGASALLSNTTGFGNTAIGGLPLFSNTEGDDNTALGNGALFS